MNVAIMTYLEKLIKRYHLLIIITIISSVHQFRNQLADNPEVYNPIITTLRKTLNTVCFRNMTHVEKHLDSPP